MNLQLFTCTDHDVHWPSGAASIVLAPTEAEARQLLDQELRKRGLKSGPYTLVAVPLDQPRAVILRDGDY